MPRYQEQRDPKLDKLAAIAQLYSVLQGPQIEQQRARQQQAVSVLGLLAQQQQHQQVVEQQQRQLAAEQLYQQGQLAIGNRQAANQEAARSDTAKYQAGELGLGGQRIAEDARSADLRNSQFLQQLGFSREQMGNELTLGREKLGVEKDIAASNANAGAIGHVLQNSQILPLEQQLRVAGLINPGAANMAQQLHQQNVQATAQKLLPAYQSSPPDMQAQLKASLDPDAQAALVAGLSTAPPVQPKSQSSFDPTQAGAAVGNTLGGAIADLPSHVFNTGAGGLDFLLGILGLGGRNGPNQLGGLRMTLPSQTGHPNFYMKQR